VISSADPNTPKLRDISERLLTALLVLPDLNSVEVTAIIYRMFITLGVIHIAESRKGGKPRSSQQMLRDNWVVMAESIKRVIVEEVPYEGDEKETTH